MTGEIILVAVVASIVGYRFRSSIWSSLRGISRMRASGSPSPTPTPTRVRGPWVQKALAHVLWCILGLGLLWMGIPKGYEQVSKLTAPLKNPFNDPHPYSGARTQTHPADSVVISGIRYYNVRTNMAPTYEFAVPYDKIPRRRTVVAWFAPNDKLPWKLTMFVETTDGARHEATGSQNHHFDSLPQNDRLRQGYRSECGHPVRVITATTRP